MEDKKELIVTADDFGLAKEINNGIIKSYIDGIVTSTALLVNTPGTRHAVELCKSVPGLEIGLHLSLVEGLSLLSKKSTISDSLCYFGDGQVCLYRDWKAFLSKFVLGQISLKELEKEFELQIQQFLEFFPKIPFLNGTQHLHVVPKIQDIVIRLALQYDVGAIRVPHRTVRLFPEKGRGASSLVLSCFGWLARRKLLNTQIVTADHFRGFEVSGSVTEEFILKVITKAMPGITELMVHPGYSSKYLQEHLPWAYSQFGWETELKALTSSVIRKKLTDNEISLTTFEKINNRWRS